MLGSLNPVTSIVKLSPVHPMLPWFILAFLRGPTVNKRFFWILLISLCAFPFALSAQQYDPTMYQELRWRMIGPFRGGRTVSMTGVPGQQNVFYMAPNNGGVWKSTDFGRTWNPIFDDQPTQSSGEGLRRPDLSVGDGMYKSIDAGKTWIHLGVAGSGPSGSGLRDAQQIASI